MPVRLTAAALTVPATDIDPVPVIAAAVPPSSTPAIVRLLPSRRVKPPAVKSPSVPIWLVAAVRPLNVVAPVEPPDSVPATSVLVALIVPPVATSETVPAPPSVSTPGMAMFSAQGDGFGGNEAVVGYEPHGGQGHCGRRHAAAVQQDIPAGR